jgi:hypothetical protein
VSLGPKLPRPTDRLRQLVRVHAAIIARRRDACGRCSHARTGGTTPATWQKARQLAEFADVDVDDFVAYVVNELHAQEEENGRMRARASEREGADVIPLRDEQGRRRPRG